MRRLAQRLREQLPRRRVVGGLESADELPQSLEYLSRERGRNVVLILAALLGPCPLGLAQNRADGGRLTQNRKMSRDLQSVNSDETVNVIGRPCDVLPLQAPLKSSGVGRDGAQAQPSRIAIPPTNCHSVFVSDRTAASSTTLRPRGRIDCYESSG